MTFSAFIDKIRERAEVRFAYEPSLIYDILDEIESEVTERIKELEELVESYERVIETSRNQYIPKQEGK